MTEKEEKSNKQTTNKANLVNQVQDREKVLKGKVCQRFRAHKGGAFALKLFPKRSPGFLQLSKHVAEEVHVFSGPITHK